MDPLPFSRQLSLVLGRTWRDAVRDLPLAFVAPTLLAAFVAVIFGAAFEAIGDSPGYPAEGFVDWVAPGSVLLTAFVGAGYAASGLLRDIETGYLDRLRLLPLRPAALLAGRAGFEGLRVLPAATMVLVSARLLGAEQRGGVAGSLAVLAVTGFVAVTWNGVFFAVALRRRDQQAVLGLQPLFMPIVMLSTFFAPTDGGPGWFRAAAGINPFTLVLDGARGILLGRADWVALGVGLVAFGALGLVTYRASARALAGLAEPG